MVESAPTTDSPYEEETELAHFTLPTGKPQSKSSSNHGGWGQADTPICIFPHRGGRGFGYLFQTLCQVARLNMG